MKVTIELESVKEPYAEIHAKEITEEITKAVSLLEGEYRESILAVERDEKYIILKPEEIYMVRVEKEKVVVYTTRDFYYARSRLYEMEQRLGKDFLRISKTTIVNLNQLDSVEPSFSGTMYLKLKNGCKDYISRKYLPQFKKYLGL
ncbi:hypothetical protein lbkm_3671 [Lachnospiraceae bacterium KM106-2]|nr:hypothetical protein lbkm_3671 [Lachnospiraceae bacterium KM106-2]